MLRAIADRRDRRDARAGRDDRARHADRRAIWSATWPSCCRAGSEARRRSVPAAGHTRVRRAAPAGGLGAGQAMSFPGEHADDGRRGDRSRPRRRASTPRCAHARVRRRSPPRRRQHPHHGERRMRVILTAHAGARSRADPVRRVVEQLSPPRTHPGRHAGRAARGGGAGLWRDQAAPVGARRRRSPRSAPMRRSTRASARRARSAAPRHRAAQPAPPEAIVTAAPRRSASLQRPNRSPGGVRVTIADASYDSADGLARRSRARPATCASRRVAIQRGPAPGQVSAIVEFRRMTETLIVSTTDTGRRLAL